MEALTAEGIDTPNCRKEIANNASKIRAHNPFVGPDGLIRVGSRLTNALIEEKTKFPIILPKTTTIPRPWFATSTRWRDMRVQNMSYVN